MNKMLIAGAGIVAFLSGASGAWAFTTQPVSPETMSNRLADPDELADKMSNGQSGGATFGVTRQPETSVFGTTVERHREQPICYHPKYSIRAERTLGRALSNAPTYGKSGLSRPQERPPESGRNPRSVLTSI
jgi:hypothetical protein